MAATTNPELTIRNIFVSNSLRLSTAESCTGGLVANRLTNIDGSSAYFLGGVVAYSNAAKVALLGVRESDLDHFGAVSEPVARAMAEGARVVFGSEYAIGVTGIAGPGGGTPEKPVGLVYIAVAGPGGARVEKHQFSGDRLTIKSSTADRALAMLLEAVS